jgi:hypothetical protein
LYSAETSARAGSSMRSISTRRVGATWITTEIAPPTESQESNARWASYLVDCSS